jgi:hypothetical protein
LSCPADPQLLVACHLIRYRIAETFAEKGLAGMDELVDEFAACVETTFGKVLIGDHLVLWLFRYGWDGVGRLVADPDQRIFRDAR